MKNWHILSENTDAVHWSQKENQSLLKVLSTEIRTFLVNKSFGFLARDLAKALNMLFLIPYPKFSTFSTFYKFLIFFTNLLALYNKNVNIFGSDLTKMDQNGSNLIKLDTKSQIFHFFHILQILNLFYQFTCPI